MKKKTLYLKNNSTFPSKKKNEPARWGCTEPCNGKNDAHTEAWNIFPLFFLEPI